MSGDSIRVRPLRPDERSSWLRMRQALWPSYGLEFLANEQEEILGTPDRQAVFVAERSDGALAGFVEVSMRDQAEGCASRPVGYVEGWYVEPEHRLRGVGRSLIEAAQRWSRDRGSLELASDADLVNETSQAAHRALGFEEINRLVLFRKSLAPEAGAG